MLYNNLGINASGHLTFAGHDTVTLAARYDTPLLVMDEALIRQRCRIYRQAMEAFLPAGSRPLYASKALSMKQMYRIMAEENMGVDVVSAGELYTAAAADFPMENVFFHGNSKTNRDIAMAMDLGVGYFVCDNLDELNAIDREARRRGIRQKLLLRLTPGIDPHTHEKINTGRIDSKFGAAIETGQAEALIVETLSRKNVHLKGYHCHIGSQVFEPDPFRDGAVLMLRFAAEIFEKHHYAPHFLNLGGGMGVPYTEKDATIDYSANIQAIGALISETCEALSLPKPAILMEPGRSIVADAGITLYTVESTKEIPGYKRYVAIDGGMTDNPRYTLYQAEYTVLPANQMTAEADKVYTVAGCCCESGDLIQEDVPLPKCSRGDLLAVLTTGAYNYSMASNYNRVPRPPIVMLGQQGDYLAVRRESFDDLIQNDL